MILVVSQSSKDVKSNATYSEVRANDLEWPKHRSPEYWDYRKKWSEYPEKMIVPEFPLCLDIETTNICNLQCTMCSRTIQIEDGTYSDIGTMPMDLFKKIIDEGSKYKLPSIKLNYLGEPLADKYIVERIRYAKQKGVIDVMFNTNGSLLDEETSHKILEAGLDSIYFSVDGIHAETFNKIRIGTDYEIVLKNIKNFMKIKNNGNFKHVQTRVSMTVLPGMEKEIQSYTNFWLPIVGQVGFGEWVDATGKGTNPTVSNAMVHTNYPYNPDFVCAQPFQRMFIMWDGVCTPCCPDVGRKYVTGNANNSTVKEIWNGPSYQRMRDVQISGRYFEIDICKECYVPQAQSNAVM
jgi:radical SAM protein with 4Fe4S-binding SPASM domain